VATAADIIGIPALSLLAKYEFAVNCRILQCSSMKTDRAEVRFRSYTTP